MKKKFIKLLLLTLIITMLSACSIKRQVIAYTAYPIGYILDRIGGDKISTYQIQTDEIIQLAQIADDYESVISDNNVTLFHIGDLEPYLDVYTKELSASNINSIDLSSKNATYEFQRYTLVYVNGESQYIEGPYYDSDLFDMVDTYSKDLALWVSPIGMLSMANDIKEYLANNNVEYAKYFEENYSSLENDLVKLDAQYQILSHKLEANNETVKFVSMTPSFGNWQKDYGFQVYPIILSKYGVLPNDKQLEVIKARIIQDQVKYIVYEPNMSSEMIDLFNTLEEELGLTRVNMDNLSSLTESEKNDNKDYVSIMYENLGILENMATEQMENANDLTSTDQTIIEENYEDDTN